MKKKLIRVVLTAILLTVAYLLTANVPMAMHWQLCVYLIPYILISYDVLGEAVEGLLERDPFDEDFLMAIATIGALLIGFLPDAEPQFAEAVFVMLFFQIGEMFEHYAEDKSKDSIAELMDLRPDSAIVLRAGQEETVSPEQVKVGEEILVKPGQKVPLDGTILEGDSELNTVALTGESMPRSVCKGDEVISGCVNLSGLLRVRVSKTFGESTASKIIEMVEESGKNKSRNETFIRKFAHVYTPIVVVLALMLAFIPPFFYDSYMDAFATWLYRALAFLVLSCPCALVMSVPLTFFAGIGGASNQGILIKGGNFMDVLSRLKTVVFDKTGTLTKGVFAVDAVHPERINEHELLHLAAHVERHSSHPIAAALRTAYPHESDDCEVSEVEEMVGRGIKARVNGKTVYVGNSKLMEEIGVKMPDCSCCAEVAGSVIHVAVEDEYSGHIVISDQVKDDASAAIASLRHLGVSGTVMLTGDRAEVGRTVAEEVGICCVYSELLPADKVHHMERLLASKAEGDCLAFVGDGINDAPVLALADVGVAMGGMGSDAAIEAADVVLMDDRLSKLVQAIRIAKRTIAIAKQNTIFAILVKAAILIFIATGFLGTWAMPVAVFGDVGVMLIAVLNAMRALRVPH